MKGRVARVTGMTWAKGRRLVVRGAKGKRRARGRRGRGGDASEAKEMAKGEDGADNMEGGEEGATVGEEASARAGRR